MTSRHPDTRHYESPILDQVAREAFARLVLAGDEGMTIRELAEQIERNPSTTANVLRGGSVLYGAAPFARAGRHGRAYRWRARGLGGAR